MKKKSATVHCKYWIANNPFAAIMALIVGGRIMAIGARTIVPVTVMLLALGCTETPESGPPRLLGLSAGAGSFTTTECVVSVLYDAMSVEWNNGRPDPRRMPATRFVILASPEARGRPLRLDLRGHSTPPGAGALRLQIGQNRSALRTAGAEYSLTATGALSADSDLTQISVALELSEPEGETAAMLTLDSVDASITGCSDDRRS